MNTDAINEIRKAAEAATPGPWYTRKGAASIHVWNHNNPSDLATSGHICGMSDGYMPTAEREANAELIALLRNNAEELCRLAEIGQERLEESHRTFFWERVSKNAENGCWEWTGAYRGTYGATRVGHNLYAPAHRVSYQMHKGHIPDELHICHKCNNPKCVNPEHLYAGLPMENMRDSIVCGSFPAGRKNGMRMRPEAVLRGERCPRAKLTEADVLEIRASKLSQKELAQHYQVSQQTISKVINRSSWAHVSELRGGK